MIAAEFVSVLMKEKDFIEMYDQVLRKNRIKLGEVSRGFGWQVSEELHIRPLFKELVSWRSVISMGLETKDTFYSTYINLFKAGNPLGVQKPKNPKEMLEVFDSLLRKEASEKRNMFYIIKKNEEIVGIMQL